MMLVDYEPWHLEAIKLPRRLRALAARMGAAERFRELAARGMVGTIVSSDPPALLGIMGFCPMEEEVAEVFIWSGFERRRFGRVFAKTVLLALHALRDKFSRIDALGDETPETDRWLKWLGFEKQGLVERPEFQGKQMRLWSFA